MPVWIKHVRHWLLSSGPSNWTWPWFLTRLLQVRRGQRSHVSRKSQAILSQERKRHRSSFPILLILPAHLPPSSEFPPSKHICSDRLLLLSHKAQTMTGPRIFPPIGKLKLQMPSGGDKLQVSRGQI